MGAAKHPPHTLGPLLPSVSSSSAHGDYGVHDKVAARETVSEQLTCLNSGVKFRIIASNIKKNLIMPFVATWIDLEIIRVRKKLS